MSEHSNLFFCSFELGQVIGVFTFPLFSIISVQSPKDHVIQTPVNKNNKANKQPTPQTTIHLHEISRFIEQVNNSRQKNDSKISS